MSSMSSPLAPQLQRFLAHKRALGYAYHGEEELLRRLDSLAVEADISEPIVDESLVRGFVASGGRGSRSHRLSLVRQLAIFLAPEEPMTFVPPRRFLGARRNIPVVRVLSRDEACRFLDACGELTDSWAFPHRGLIHGTLLRVLLLTGLRCGEALGLKVSEVDLHAKIIHVQRGKFGKSRLVPIADDLADQLLRCDDVLRASIPGRWSEDAFFPGPDGHRTGHHSTLYRSFRRVLGHAGITHGGRGEGPRIHDARHTFAVLRLLTWYEQGADLRAKLPLLATYLGHVHLANSQVYLHMTYDLVGEVTRRVEDRFGDVITAEVMT